MKNWIILFLVFGFISCGFFNKTEVGKYYSFGYKLDDNNPFEKLELDTVKVIAISGGYVLIEFKNSHKISTDLDFFEKYSHPLN